MPGVMQGTSGEQTPPNQDDSGLALGSSRMNASSSGPAGQGAEGAAGTHAWMALEMMPTMRPNVAPTAIDGTKMPAGTLQPYDRMMRPVRTTVASRSVLTFLHWAHVLQSRHARGGQRTNAAQQAKDDGQRGHALAEVVVVAAALALLEQDRHALGHVDPEEVVEVRHERGRAREDDSLGDAVARQVFAPERGDLQVVLDDERAVQSLLESGAKRGQRRAVSSGAGRRVGQT